MPETSQQIAQLLAEIYASSAKSASSLTYSLQTKKAEPIQKRAAYLGKSVANTTQAVTHALVAAGLNGTRGIAEASLAASGLSLLCSLPSAIDALNSLGVNKPAITTKELYTQSESKTHAATKAFKTSLLVTGPIKHDNIGRLVFNLPLELIQDTNNHDLFPLVKKHLIQQKRGDAIKFYKQWMQTSDKQKTLTASFQDSLAQYHKEGMKAPIISLAEVAAFLSMLDPEKDEKEIQAYSELFKLMLTDFRTALSQDIDCASALDESNQVLLNLMVTTYTGRAHRKKIEAKNLTIGKHVLTGVGVVLSAVLAVHTAGLSLPATALLAGKISSTSVSVLSTATRIAQMVKEGHAAEEIASLLSPEVIHLLNESNVSEELLKGAQKSAEDFDNDLSSLYREVQSLSRQTYHELIELEKDPLHILLKLDNDDILREVLQDERFMLSLNKKINQSLQPAEIYRQMLNQISRDRSLPGTHAFSIKRAKLDILNVVISYLMDPSETVSGTLKACAQKNESHIFINGTFEKQREKAQALNRQKLKLDDKIKVLSSLEKQIDAHKRLLHMNIGLLNHKSIPDSPTGKLLKANDYIEAVEESQMKITEAMKSAEESLLELEGKLAQTVGNTAPTAL